MGTRKKNLSNDIDKIVQSIDFGKLVKYFEFPRFPRIFPDYAKTFQNLVSTSDDTKNEFVRYCLETNEKEFVALLLISGQYTAVEMIEPNTLDIIDATKLDPIVSRITSNCQYIKDLHPNRDIIARTAEFRSLSSNQYSMTKTPRGIFLLINNYLTFGTFKEIQRLRNIFYQLHFKVIVEKNLTAQEIIQKFQTLSTDARLANHDAFACYIISHGSKEGEINGFDFEPLCMKEMCGKFDDKNCPNLKGKPKLFFFNCCCVQSIDANISEKFTPSQKIYAQIPSINDMLICYSTQYGYEASVDWDAGTKFGSIFCDTLVEKVLDRDFSSILTRINKSLHDEQPIYWNDSFRHNLSFGPSHPFMKMDYLISSEPEVICKNSELEMIQSSTSKISANNKSLENKELKSDEDLLSSSNKLPYIDDDDHNILGNQSHDSSSWQDLSDSSDQTSFDEEEQQLCAASDKGYVVRHAFKRMTDGITMSNSENQVQCTVRLPDDCLYECVIDKTSSINELLRKVRNHCGYSEFEMDSRFDVFFIIDDSQRIWLTDEESIEKQIAFTSDNKRNYVESPEKQCEIGVQWNFKLRHVISSYESSEKPIKKTVDRKIETRSYNKWEQNKVRCNVILPNGTRFQCKLYKTSTITDLLEKVRVDCGYSKFDKFQVFYVIDDTLMFWLSDDECIENQIECGEWNFKLKLVAALYLWKPKRFALKPLQRVGHLSLKLYDGTYISHWPNKQNLWNKLFKRSKHYAYITLEDDIIEKKGEPDKVLYLERVKFLEDRQSEIREWWFDYNSNWNLLNKKCAQKVKHALEICRFFTNKKLNVQSPTAVFNYVKDAIKECHKLRNEYHKELNDVNHILMKELEEYKELQEMEETGQSVESIEIIRQLKDSYEFIKKQLEILEDNRDYDEYELMKKMNEITKKIIVQKSRLSDTEKSSELNEYSNSSSSEKIKKSNEALKIDKEILKLQQLYRKIENQFVGNILLQSPYDIKQVNLKPLKFQLELIKQIIIENKLHIELIDINKNMLIKYQENNKKKEENDNKDEDNDKKDEDNDKDENNDKKDENNDRKDEDNDKKDDNNDNKDKDNDRKDEDNDKKGEQNDKKDEEENKKKEEGNDKKDEDNDKKDEDNDKKDENNDKKDEDNDKKDEDNDKKDENNDKKDEDNDKKDEDNDKKWEEENDKKDEGNDKRDENNYKKDKEENEKKKEEILKKIKENEKKKLDIIKKIMDPEKEKEEIFKIKNNLDTNISVIDEVIDYHRQYIDIDAHAYNTSDSRNETSVVIPSSDRIVKCSVRLPKNGSHDFETDKTNLVSILLDNAKNNCDFSESDKFDVFHISSEKHKMWLSTDKSIENQVKVVKTVNEFELKLVAALYLWKPKFRLHLLKPLQRIGHLSLKLYDGTYISHWPRKRRRKWKKIRPKLTKESDRHKTLEEDISKEDGNPKVLYFERVKFFNTRQDRIINWWQKNESIYYNLVFKNCAQIVLKALFTGNLLPNRTLFFPTDVFKYIKRYLKNYDQLRDQYIREFDDLNRILVEQKAQHIELSGIDENCQSIESIKIIRELKELYGKFDDQLEKLESSRDYDECDFWRISNTQLENIRVSNKEITERSNQLNVFKVPNQEHKIMATKCLIETLQKRNKLYEKLIDNIELRQDFEKRFHANDFIVRLLKFRLNVVRQLKLDNQVNLNLIKINREILNQ